MSSVLKYKHTIVPKQQGELARLKVLQGPDAGVFFVITSRQVTMGRGDENDIVLSDLKTSRKHAEFSLTESGWKVRDLGSSNGIQWNGKQVVVAELQPNDMVSLGETTLEFFNADVASSVLSAPPRALMEVRKEHSNFDTRREEVLALSGKKIPLEAKGPSHSRNPLQANKKTGAFGLVVLGILALVLLFSSSDSKKNEKKKEKKGEERDLASYLPQTSGLEKDKTVERFFKTGFREYRERNYLRAKSHFETVLQIAPNHPLAKLYLANCEKSIGDEVKQHLERGKKGLASGKIKSARGHFEAVLRLLYRDQSSPQYLEARESLDRLDKELSKEEGGEGG